jgi:magnesium transporter
VIAHVAARPTERVAGGVRLLSPEELDAMLAQGPVAAGLIWLDLADPQPDDVGLLRRAFGFHPIALEDVVLRHQRPKIDEYPGYYFCVLYAVRVDQSRHVLSTSELQFFWSRDYLVTIHHDPFPEIEDVARRLSAGTLEPIGHDAGEPLRVADLAYRIVDAIIDGYFPLVDAVAEWSEDMEEEMFSRAHGADTLQSIFMLKKDVARVRQKIAPGRDVLNVALRRDQPLFEAEMVPYFQDLYDHSVRAADSLDTYREVLASALETYLSVVSNDVNQTVKRMTAVTAILMVDALVAGIYGMNFDNIPELHLGYGYAYALALMVALSVGLWALFRRIEWL